MKKLHLVFGQFLLLLWGFLAISGPGANLEASFRRSFRRQPGLEPQERIAVLTYLKYQDGITPADMRRQRRKNLIPTSSYTPRHRSRLDGRDRRGPETRFCVRS